MSYYNPQLKQIRSEQKIAVSRPSITQHAKAGDAADVLIATRQRVDSLGHGIKDFDAANLVKINTSVPSDTEVANLEVAEQKAIPTVSTENP